MSRPSRPQIDPRAAVKARIAALPSKSGGDPADTVTTGVDCRRGAFSVIVEAARERRLSVPAYIRRAAYVLAAHDLDLPLSEVLAHDPRLTRDTGYALEDPEGALFGPWEIARLVGEGPGNG